MQRVRGVQALGGLLRFGAGARGRNSVAHTSLRCLEQAQIPQDLAPVVFQKSEFKSSHCLHFLCSHRRLGLRLG